MDRSATFAVQISPVLTHLGCGHVFIVSICIVKIKCLTIFYCSVELTLVSTGKVEIVLGLWELLSG
jgi:hypothetical protein